MRKNTLPEKIWTRYGEKQMYNFLDLSSDDIEKMKIPYNTDMDNRKRLVYDVIAMYNNAWNYGGTLLRVANSSGYISAINEYFGKIIGQYQDATAEKSKEVLLVVEAYVNISGDCDKLDRIFLIPPKWSKEVNELLMGMGRSVKGFACLTRNDLEKLCGLGYQCIHNQLDLSKDDVSGFLMYDEVFGKKRIMMDFRAISCNDGLGGLFNPAIYIDDGESKKIIMPDAFATNIARNIIDAETYIRKHFDAKFFIERIEIDREKEKETVEGILKEYFNYLWMDKFDMGRLPDGFEDMLYQTAYIKRCYPNVYEKIWLNEYSPEFMPMDVKDIMEYKNGLVGISMGEYTTYVVLRDDKREFRRIPGNVRPLEADYVRYQFNGIGDLYNAGVAYSEAALGFDDIRENVVYATGSDIDKICVSITEPIPSRSDIHYYMYGPKSNSRTQLDLICYDEIKDRDLDGYGVISEAAKLVEMPETKVDINPGMAIVAAIDEETKLPIRNGELALAVCIEYDSYSVYLCTKDTEGLGYFTYAYGAKSYWDNRYILRDILKEEIKKEIKRICAWDNLSEEELQGDYGMWYKNYSRLEHQFTRCDKAVFKFQGGGYSVEPELSIKAFNKYLEKIVADIRETTERMLEGKSGQFDREYNLGDIDRVYLAGDMSDYPYYREAFRSMCNAAVYVSGEPETVMARGAILLEG
jgi:hypothetical protein